MRAGFTFRAATATLCVCAAAACAGNDEREVIPPVVLGMLETTPPAYDDGEVQIYQVSRDVRLPFRQVTDAERPKGEVDPYRRPAFHLAKDSRITVSFTLSNLEDRRRTVELLIDPWNEFVRYVPGFATIDEEDVQPNFSGIQRTFIVEPKGRVRGIITPDDMVELATDLTVAMALEKRPPDPMGALGGPALYNRTMERQNRSSEPDAVLGPWLPQSRATVAAVTGFSLGLRTEEPAKLAVELVIEIQDLNGERVVIDGDEGKQIGRPGDALSPPAVAR